MGENCTSAPASESKLATHPSPEVRNLLRVSDMNLQFGYDAPRMSKLGDVDIHLFAEGTHARAYEGFGAHVARRDRTPAGVLGVDFAVWAPNADSVHVIGDFENWGERPAPLARRGETGIWEGRIAGVGHGTRYKYRIVSRNRRLPGQQGEPAALY